MSKDEGELSKSERKRQRKEEKRARKKAKRTEEEEPKTTTTAATTLSAAVDEDVLVDGSSVEQVVEKTKKEKKHKDKKKKKEKKEKKKARKDADENEKHEDSHSEDEGESKKRAAASSKDDKMKALDAQHVAESKALTGANDGKIVASSAIEFYDEEVKAKRKREQAQRAQEVHKITLLLFYTYVEPVWDESTYNFMLKTLQEIGDRLQLTGRMRVAREGLNCTLTGTVSFHARFLIITDQP